MQRTFRFMLAAAVAAASMLVTTQQAAALELGDLLGTWNMSYDNGQGQQTGTITVSRNDDGSAKIMMSTSGGGASEARDIKIENDTLTYSRPISAQGQALDVNYTAKLTAGRLEGTYTLDLGELAGALGGAAGGLGEPTPWTATRAQ